MNKAKRILFVGSPLSIAARELVRLRCEDGGAGIALAPASPFQPYQRKEILDAVAAPSLTGPSSDIGDAGNSTPGDFARFKNF